MILQCVTETFQNKKGSIVPKIGCEKRAKGVGNKDEEGQAHVSVSQSKFRRPHLDVR